MIGRLNRHQGGDREAEPLGVEERHPALDHPFALQALDALPARGLRQADALPDLGDRQGRVFLEEREDVEVGGVRLQTVQS